MEEGGTRLTIPTTVAPRYIPPTDQSEEAKAIAKIPYSLDSPAPMTITVNTITKTKILAVKCPSHVMDTKINAGVDHHGNYGSTSTLQGKSTDMDRDVIFLMQTQGEEKPTVFLETNSNGSTAAMVSLIPSFKLEEQKVELIFLVDRSGSMDWDGGIRQATEALQLFIHSLPADCFFNIWSFGSHFDALFKESQQYTDDSLNEAMSHISKMCANYGGTEIYAPLKAIYEKHRPSVQHLRQVFVLTDGQVNFRF